MTDEPVSDLCRSTPRWRREEVPSLAPGVCHCDARYSDCDHEPRNCDTPGGGHRSPYFCPDCDKRRIDHISQNLADIRAELLRDRR